MSETVRPKQPGRRVGYRLVGALLVLAAAYFAVTYVLVPAWWKRYERRHPALDAVPGITTTGSGIPGDPLNVNLVGTKPELVKAMLAAGWHPADPLSLKSCLEIAEATILKRDYENAPVSSLYLFGRKEDLAFEMQVGDNPRERHHVRFWRAPADDPGGRPTWLGSATFDKDVGFSHTTGQFTHHIAADVDLERDHLFRTLEHTGRLERIDVVDGFHKVRSGRNGEGDAWTTDGRLYVGVIKPDNTR